MFPDAVLPGHEEGALLARAKLGDRDAFSCLVEAHEQFIGEVCCRILGNPEDGEDCAQETFLRAYRSLKHFRGQSAFRTWLYRIAVNLCLTHRAKRRPPVLPVEELDDTLRSTIGQPEEDILRQEFLGTVQQAFASLPVDQRAILVLRDVKALSYEEIADILGCPVGTVRSRLSRARLAMRTRVRGRELFDAKRV